MVDLGDGEPRIFRLPEGNHRVGAGPDCAIRLPENAPSCDIQEIVINSAGFEVLANDPAAPEEDVEVTRSMHGFSESVRVGKIELRIRPAEQEDELNGRLDALGTGRSGHYTIGPLIAEGGMGSVSRADEELLGRTVAMKVMRHKGDPSETGRIRFLREAMVLARLEHPNIVPIHDFGRNAQGEIYYTMKLVQGRTLREIIEGLKENNPEIVDQFPLDRLLNDFRKVCDAVAFAHSKGVIHRDLKPDNIMIGAFGEVMVMDWGLAKILTESKPDPAPGGAEFDDFSDHDLHDLRATLTMDGYIVGTPQFMPPEQADGRVSDIDARSDIFSLGGILYSMLTLRPPVTGKTVREIFKKISEGKINHPSSYNKTPASRSSASGKSPKAENIVLSHLPGQRVPEALGAVAMLALSARQEDRYQSVHDLQAEIVSYQSGFATTAEGISAWGLIWLFMKRNRAVTISTCLLALITVFFVIRLIESESDATEAARLANEERIKATDERNRANREKAKADEERNKANIAKLKADEEAANARAAEGRAKAEQQLTKQALYRSQITLAESEFLRGNIRSFRELHANCEPERRDSDWHFLQSMDRRSTLILTNSPAMSGGRFAFDRSGEKFVGVKRGGYYGVYDGKTREPILEFRRSELQHHGFDFSPDGKWIASAGHNRSVIDIIDAATGKTRQLLDCAGDKELKQVAFSPDGKRLAVASFTRKGYMIDISQNRVLWETYAMMLMFYSPDGRTLATVLDTQANGTRPIVLIDAKTGRELRRLPNSAQIYEQAMRFSPDSKLLLCAGKDRTARLWEVETGRLRHVFNTRAVDARAIGFSPNGKFLAVADGNIVGIYETATGSLIEELRGHINPVDFLVFDPDGQHLLTSALSEPVRLWKLELATQLTRFAPGPYSDAVSVAFVDGGTNYLALWKRYVIKGNSRTGELVNTNHLRENWITDNLLNADESMLAMYSANKRVIQFLHPERLTIQKGWNVRKRMGTSSVRSVNWDPTGQSALVGTKYGYMILVRTTGEVKFRSSKTDNIRQARFTPDGNRVLSVLSGGEVVCQEAYSNTRKYTLKPDANGYALCLDIHPGGKLFATGSDDKRVRVFDLDTGRLKLTFRAHLDQVSTLCFSPDGSLIATGSDDRSIRLFDVDTGGPRLILNGHNGAITHLAFSPDQALLASSSKDSTARTWSLAALANSPTAPGPPVGTAEEFLKLDQIARSTNDLGGVIVWGKRRGAHFELRLNKTDAPKVRELLKSLETKNVQSNAALAHANIFASLILQSTSSNRERFEIQFVSNESRVLVKFHNRGEPGLRRAVFNSREGSKIVDELLATRSSSVVRQNIE